MLAYIPAPWILWALEQPGSQDPDRVPINWVPNKGGVSAQLLPFARIALRQRSTGVDDPMLQAIHGGVGTTTWATKKGPWKPRCF